MKRACTAWFMAAALVGSATGSRANATSAPPESARLLVTGTAFSHPLRDGDGSEGRDARDSGIQVVPPSITTQPSDQRVVAGGTATFTVAVAGTPPFTYQWFKNGSAIPGATSDTLTLTNPSWELTPMYSVFVTNSAGQITSNHATLKVVPQLLFTNMYAMPTDVTAIVYPDDYLKLTPQSVLLYDPYCTATQSPVWFPASYLDATRLPAISGAPFAPGIKRVVWLNDIWVPSTSVGPPKVPGCPEPGTLADFHAEYVSTLKRVAAIGVDTISLVQTFTIHSEENPTVVLDPGLGMSEQDFGFAVAEAAKEGLAAIMWVEWIPPWSGSTGSHPVSPEWFDAFLVSYSAFMLEQARLAEKYGIGALMLSKYVSVTGELGGHSVFNSRVSKLIADMRQVYHGQIMLGDAFQALDDPQDIADVCNAVDVIMAAPHMVLPPSTPIITMTNLRGAYRDWFAKWSSRYGRFGKPLYMFEPVQSLAGWPATGGAEEFLCYPGCPQLGLTTDFALQAMAAEAMYEEAAIAHATGVVRLAMVGSDGYWYSDPLMPVPQFYGTGAFPNFARSVRNKPAESIVAAWFARYSLSASTATFEKASGSGSVTVSGTSLTRNVRWSASSPVDWVRITAPAGGSAVGDATVTYDVAPFTGYGSRTATVTVAGQAFTVRQKGLPAVAPAISVEPSNRTVTAGWLATFTAAASGLPAPTVQWQVSTDSGSTWTDVIGAISAPYIFTTAAGDNGKQFRAVFTNEGGSATSQAASLTVRAAPAGPPPVQMVDVTFRLSVPPETAATDTVAMVTGVIFGVDMQWRPMTKSGSVWTLTLSLPKGSLLRYGYRLNDWPTSEWHTPGTCERLLAITGSMTVDETVSAWQMLSSGADRTGILTGTITSTADGKPIVDAIVSAGPYQVRTGYGGKYRLINMPAGTNIVSVYMDNGAYRLQTAPVTMASGGSATVDMALTPAAMRQVTFSPVAPASTPVNAQVRMIGDRETLGFLPPWRSAVLDSTRVLDMAPLAERWTYTATLGEGTTVAYVYTLGETTTNLERDESGIPVVRYVTVGASDFWTTDAPADWQRPNDVAVTLNVTSPTADTVFLAGDDLNFQLPVKMWPLGGNTWTYTRFVSPNRTFKYQYRRADGDSLGLEKLNPDAATNSRSVAVGTDPVTSNDTVTRWRFQLQETLPSSVALKSNATFVPRINGESFITGTQLMDYWRTSWKPLVAASGAFVSSMNARYMELVPCWSITSSDPPLFEWLVSGMRRQELIEHIRAMKAQGLKVNLYPQPVVTQVPFAGMERHNTDAWYDAFFAEQLEYELYHAEIAEAEGVELFTIQSFYWNGEEMGTGSASGRAKINQKMKEIIAAVQKVYHGAITATPVKSFPEYDWIGDLDYIGAGWWTPLATTTTATVEEMTATALKYIDENLLPQYERFHKPILIGAVAYYSADSSAMQTYRFYDPQISASGPETSTPSAWQQQADALEASFSAFGQRAFIQGAFVFTSWYYALDAKDFSVRGKTAQYTLALMFNKLHAATDPVAPAVTTQPANAAVAAGATASFTASASGTPAPTMQWQRSSNGGSTWVAVTGATSATFSFPTAAGDHGTRFRAVFTNSAGTATTSAATLAVYGPAGVSPSSLHVGAVKAAGSATLSSQTAAQWVTVTFTGAPSAWTVSTTQQWLNITGGSGSAAGTFTVAIRNPSDVIGANTSLSGTINITSPTAPNTPLTIPVTLAVSRPGASSQPFGAFDTPADGTTGMQGSFAVTGWALDDVGIDRVEIWRDLVAGEPANHAYTTDPSHPAFGKVFIAYPLFVTGSRTDVEGLYPTVPFANRAGWGYLLLSWGLHGHGNGTYKLYAYAYDVDGHNTLLGTKTIAVDNAHATKPFGAIDTPSYGGTASGAGWNFGWALTPNATAGDAAVAGVARAVSTAGAAAPCTITNGSVTMHIDSGAAHVVNYGDLRTDIAASFAGFSNGNNSGGASYLDTTTLSNGVHQLGWLVYDNCGRGDGIGSRFFNVLNGSTDASTPVETPGLKTRPTLMPEAFRVDGGPVAPPSRFARQPDVDETRRVDGGRGLSPGDQTRSPVSGVVSVRKLGGEWQSIAATADGAYVIEVAQDGRIEVQLPPVGDVGYAGGQIVGGARRALPLGSSLDAQAGIFYWQPAPGFLGRFDLEFVRGDALALSTAPNPEGVADAGGAPAAPIRGGLGDTPLRASVLSSQPTTGFSRTHDLGVAPTEANTVRMRVVVGPSIRAVIDAPAPDTLVAQPFVVAGWALDLAAHERTGVDTVHVWAYPTAGGDPIFVGIAPYGDRRLDVAAMFGEPFAGAAYNLTVDTLPPGTYDVVVYPHRAKTNTFEGAQVVRVVVR